MNTIHARIRALIANASTPDEDPWGQGHPYGRTRGSGNPNWQRAGAMASAAKRRAKTRAAALADDPDSPTQRGPWTDTDPAYRIDSFEQARAVLGAITPKQRNAAFSEFIVRHGRPARWPDDAWDLGEIALEQNPPAPAAGPPAPASARDDDALRWADAILAEQGTGEFERVYGRAPTSDSDIIRAAILADGEGAAPIPNRSWGDDHPYGRTRGSGNTRWQRAGAMASAARRRAVSRARSAQPGSHLDPNYVEERRDLFEPLDAARARIAAQQSAGPTPGQQQVIDRARRRIAAQRAKDAGAAAPQIRKQLESMLASGFTGQRRAIRQRQKARQTQRAAQRARFDQLRRTYRTLRRAAKAPGNVRIRIGRPAA